MSDDPRVRAATEAIQGASPVGCCDITDEKATELAKIALAAADAAAWRPVNEAPAGYVPAQIDPGTGICSGPQCCGQRMVDNGCDDYRCDTCGHKVRIEWPD